MTSDPYAKYPQKHMEAKITIPLPAGSIVSCVTAVIFSSASYYNKDVEWDELDDAEAVDF